MLVSLPLSHVLGVLIKYFYFFVVAVTPPADMCAAFREACPISVGIQGPSMALFVLEIWGIL